MISVTYSQVVQHAHTHYMRTLYVERKKERGEGREEGKGRERRRKAKQRMITTCKTRLRVYECTLLTDFVTSFTVTTVSLMLSNTPRNP